MKLKESQLYTENHNAKFYKQGNNLFKVFKGYVDERLEDQIVYNQSINSKINKRIILPKKVLYNDKGWMIGYKMVYVAGRNLEDEIQNPYLSYEDKIILINEFFQLLKEIHNYLIVGDIRNTNLMIGSDGNAYMIDFDYAKKSDSSDLMFCRYNILYRDCYMEDKNEDIIKLYISALSILYNLDIEQIFIDLGNSNITELFSFIPLSGFLKDYCYYIVDCVNHNKKITNYMQLPFDSVIEKEVNTARARILNR